MRIGFKILVLIVVLTACDHPFKGYSKQSSGLFFKLETIEEGKKRIQKNNYLQFKYSLKNFKGEEVDASRILLKVNDVYESGGLLEALSLINEKEIASAIFPVSKLKEELDGILAIRGMPDTALLFAQIQIDSIYDIEEFLAARKKFVEWINRTETKDFDVLREEMAMDEFQSQHNILVEETITGLRYCFLHRGKGEEAGFGKRVELQYTGRFLSGEEFNSTSQLKNGVQEFYLGNELQVIKGIEEALSMMREGDRVLLLIPSWLGFGVQGSSTGVVPPRTPIVYELSLKKVN